MNMKKIVLFTVILMIAISSMSMVSAGWFDGFVEADTFKFETPNGFSGSAAENMIILINDTNEDHLLMISETSKENYTKFLERDFVAESENSNDYDDYTYTNLGGTEVQKDINESNMRIVVLKDYGLGTPRGVTEAVIQKDNSYYYITIQHPYDTNLINADIQTIKDIEQTLERK